MTLDDLRTIVPRSGGRTAVVFEPLCAAMAEFGIDTPLRQAAFVAQCAHESMAFTRTREIWNPIQCAWQDRYEGRADLGIRVTAFLEVAPQVFAFDGPVVGAILPVTVAKRRHRTLIVWHAKVGSFASSTSHRPSARPHGPVC